MNLSDTEISHNLGVSRQAIFKMQKLALQNLKKEITF